MRLEKRKVEQNKIPGQIEIDFLVAEKKTAERNNIALELDLKPEKLIQTEDLGWCYVPDLQNKLVPISELRKEKKERLEKLRQEREEDEGLSYWQK
ncbi:MAG: hypothetical protein WC662_01630 [Candidatus Paceibacterota bacterium]|jgi:hypothetical protein